MKNLLHAAINIEHDFYGNRPEKCKVPIDEAIIFLSVHFKEIRNVGEWAKRMGYSRSYFSREVKRSFQEPPKKLLRDAKFIAVFSAFLKNPEAKAIVIARETGFDNAKSLGQFLSRNFHTTIKGVRCICTCFPKSILQSFSYRNQAQMHWNT